MVFLIVIHAGLIIWASTLAISFLYRVDLSSESVKVNEALEVFGEQNVDWTDVSADSTTRQAHIRIGSRTNQDGTTRADEILEFGTYRGEQFVPKSLLRSEGDGTLEVVTNGNKLALSPNGGNVGVGTSSPNAKLDVDGETIIRGNASVGGNNQTSTLKIDSHGTSTVGLQLGPDPSSEASLSAARRKLLDSNGSDITASPSSFNKKSFGVYSMVGGEQVVMKRGNSTVLRFTEGENTEMYAEQNVVIESHHGDVNLVSTNGKIRFHGAIELGGSDLTGGISNTLGETGSAGLLSALSVTNGTVKIAAPRVVLQGRTEVNGTFVTGNGNVRLGETYDDKIDMRGTIMGHTAFTFGGSAHDEHKISLNVDEPTSGWHTIVLPDANGRLVVSAQDPLLITKKGEMQLNQSKIDTVGALKAGSILPSFGNIDIGWGEGSELKAGTLTIRNTTMLKGAVLVNPDRGTTRPIPIHFAMDSESAVNKLLTNIVIVPPTGDNNITIPDGNGTVLLHNQGEIVHTFGDIDIGSNTLAADTLRIQHHNPTEGTGGKGYTMSRGQQTLGTMQAMFNNTWADVNSTTRFHNPKGSGIRIRSRDGDSESAETETVEAEGAFIHVLAGSANRTNHTGGHVYIEGGDSYLGPAGDVFITGGRASGHGVGNTTTNSVGGDVIVTSGLSSGNETSSGKVDVLSANAGDKGVSGALTLASGTASNGDSGAFTISTGKAEGGSGGDISINVGEGDTGIGGAMTLTAGKTNASAAVGGAVTITAGEADDGSNGGTGGDMELAAGAGADVGGAVSITTGVGTAASSGAMTLATANAGLTGNSGDVSLKTGAGGTTSGNSGSLELATGHSANAGATGDVSITTGDATGGNGGDITLKVGDGDTLAGGAMTLTAGKTNASAAVGGAVTIKAGEADDGSNGGTGGDMELAAGAGADVGGAVSITTGVGTAASSGAMTLATANAGLTGNSGDVSLKTGAGGTTSGNSGSLELATGHSANAGATGDVSITTGDATGGNGGDITLKVGDGDTLAGGAMTLTAGKTNASAAVGGAVTIKAGEADDGSNGGTGGDMELAAGAGADVGGAVSITTGVGTAASSGAMTLATANAGLTGNSGDVSLKTGAGGTTSGNSGSLELATGHSANAGATGDVSITTGDATGGNGGDITLKVGDGDTLAGGAMTLTAGKTNASAAVGGAVTIKAGEADDGSNGGTGGDMELAAGAGADVGGAVSITTGVGTAASSGAMTLATANAGLTGNSGDVSLKTGAGGTTSGNSGSLELATGHSANAGATGDVSITTGDATGGNGGDITLKVGDGDTLAGGAMTLTAGKTNASAAVGGAVTIKAGEADDGSNGGTGGDMELAAGAGADVGGAVSITTGVGTAASSGAMTLATANAGLTGNSGDVSLKTGAGGTTSGNSGSLELATGTPQTLVQPETCRSPPATPRAATAATSH